MAKFNSGDILKILRKFNIANEDNVPRNIEELKKVQPDQFSEIFSFKFNNNKFFVINDGTAEDDEQYILELLKKLFGDLEGKLAENPNDDLFGFVLPFEGKDIYLFQVVPSKIRLDVALAKKYDNLSRSSIQKMVKNGLAKVNGRIITKVKELVDESTDLIELAEVQKDAKHIDLEIIYEDENVIVVNKPKGILTHSKGVLNNEFTVADFFELHGCNFAKGTNRAGIVHRLDRETSGVIIGAKNDTAAKKLQKQFSERTTKKEYIAIVEGVPNPNKAIIDLPIARNNSLPSTFIVNAKGKTAQTKYEVLESKNNRSLVKLNPKTGRTHQLRVHLAYIKHPIVGDRVYNDRYSEKDSRMFLHAKSLEISIPPNNTNTTSQRMVFESPLPNNFIL
ncbi:RluA family pseudouridine synthase [Candidatus Nanogingivalis gingivitcus]|jgi:pseudouridine synthase, rluA family|uniref:Pseudouridine synthase n=1 Tax=Candidatus Nanogingivalis gingivitcus TaxID=2171992 RepID=A0ABY0FKG6_9BACT|nr:RluA family pseudouridine synthase [Candidatus Nanogingivalis gingivitcus]RYC72814.1 Ribosomal large subunit pseudouridine synthase D [Candidatus Nanogingivalis gingivitcus]